MTGQYAHTIDAKGRLFIPAKLREELGDTFYVTMGMDSCLSIYSDASWARFTEKFESLPYTKTKAMRPLFANAAKCEPDAQGRIVLTLRELLGTWSENWPLAFVTLPRPAPFTRTCALMSGWPASSLTVPLMMRLPATGRACCCVALFGRTCAAVGTAAAAKEVPSFADTQFSIFPVC